MLTAKPKHLLSWSYEVSQGNRPLATLSVRWLREAGSLSLNGRDCKIGRDGWMSGEFYLEDGSRRIAAATKALTRRFELSTDAGPFTLRAEWFLGRAFVLEQEGHVVGSIRPAGIFSRKATIKLPEELALETQIFITWLVIVMWRRAASNSS